MMKNHDIVEEEETIVFSSFRARIKRQSVHLVSLTLVVDAYTDPCREALRCVFGTCAVRGVYCTPSVHMRSFVFV